ncbi:MAG: 2-oxo acid dehydrogenase subunit E2 [Eubacteriaceae bacterium]|nr:2-oxo acid dehydrogenase subunit E2 [Eubacteriaceae bacterium]
MAAEIILPQLELEATEEKMADGLKPESMEELRTKRETDEGLEKVRATPSARRLAKQHHIIIENIVGTGPRGRIRIEDVQSVLEAQPITTGSLEPVVIHTELEEIPGNPENYLGGHKPKESFAKRVPAIAKIMSMVDDLDLKPRLDTRGPDGRVVPGELGSIKRFKENEDNFTGDYGEYVKVLPKRVEAVAEVINIEQTSPEIIPNPALNFVTFVEEAEQMVKSHLENAVMTLTTEIDMTEVKDLRKKIAPKIEDQTKCRCTFTDFLLMAVSRSLIKHPEINSSLSNGKIIAHSYVHMGLAMGMEDGLIIPIIKNTQAMNFVEIVKNRAETLKSVKNSCFIEEDPGSTFTVTNLGMVGILEFTAIINEPNSAILSVGEVVSRMRLYQGEPMMRSVMKISLNLDHRVADGLTGARFLQDVKSDMENPSLLLF